MWGVPLYIAESFGFRKVVDATFMIGFLVTGLDVSPADVEKYLAACGEPRWRSTFAPSVQALPPGGRPGEVPRPGRRRTFGTGERIVFLPYTREVFDATQQWTQARDLFPRQVFSTGYDQAALT